MDCADLSKGLRGLAVGLRPGGAEDVVSQETTFLDALNS